MESGAARGVGDALLRLSACPDDDLGPLLAILTESEWDSLFTHAREARLLPLLSRAIERTDPAIAVPDGVSNELADELRWHQLHSLRQQATAARVRTILASGGCQFIALKGLSLAHQAYPDPVLRPMRDLDVLVTDSDANAAQEMLLASGDFVVHPDLRGTRRTSPEHLLPLQDIALRCTVEVHHCIGTWPGAEELRRLLVEQPRPLVVGGVSFATPSPETNLLHLVAGAVLKDRLSRALLALADLHFLAARGLDWDQVWDLAGKTGLRKPLALLAAVASRSGAGWIPPSLAGAVDQADMHVDAAVEALLRSGRFADRARVVDSVERASRGRGALRGALSLALAPEPMQLARISGVAPGSRWRWIGYPSWLIRRTIAFLYGAAEARRIDSDAARRLRGWLAEH